MNEKAIETIRAKETPDGFIKTTDSPVSALTAEQKVVLNRKGNELFNGGDVEKARRLFTTTGYSDGLSRVGDCYMKSNKLIAALKQYVLAHNKKKSDALCADFARMVSAMIGES